MTNHFHLVVETPLANLVAGMKWFLGTYTIRYNARHHLSGHLFAGRYKSLIVDARDAHYLRVVADYVHLNPSRAGLVKTEEELKAYRWSSYIEYLARSSRRPAWLRVDRVLGEHGIRRDDRAGRLKFSRRMEALRRDEEPASDYKEVRRGWRFGTEEFVARILDRIDGKSGENQTRREAEESMEQRAERVVAEGLARSGWDERRLETERKGHPAKVRMARRLRRETTATLRWIADRLTMGTWTHVSYLLQKIETPQRKPNEKRR
jgi:putative transposase